MHRDRHHRIESPGKMARLGVVIGAAILLTFGRGIMLNITEQSTLLDLCMNGFVLTVAPLCALYTLWYFWDFSLLSYLAPAFGVMAWVCACLFLNSPREYWPPSTPIITIFISLLVITQISSRELKLLRHCVLVIAALFSVVVLTHPGVLDQTLGGSEMERLGADVDPGNVIAVPRIYYTLVFTCLVTALIERRFWLRILVLPLVIAPMMLGLSGGGRGPLLALIAALIVFIILAWKHIGKFGVALFVMAAPLAIYKAITTLFPVLVRRASEDDSQRTQFYQVVFDDLANNLSFFGRGKGGVYAHNLFLEFLQDYGIVGLGLFLILFGLMIRLIWRVHQTTKSVEVAWVMGVMMIQLVAQQFSLNIYYPSLWAALLLPVGLAWWLERERMSPSLAQRRIARKAREIEKTGARQPA